MQTHMHTHPIKQKLTRLIQNVSTQIVSLPIYYVYLTSVAQIYYCPCKLSKKNQLLSGMNTVCIKTAQSDNGMNISVQGNILVSECYRKNKLSGI